MRATHRALCKHGYACLTMQAIADEFDKTKAVLHYHYDTKENLLVAFLDHLLEEFDRRNDLTDDDPPDRRLEALVDRLLFGPPERGTDGGFDHWNLHTALLEIRVQALHEDAFREQLTVNFETVEAMAAAIVRDGIERGTFREVDPEETATYLLSAINGARVYQLTLGREDVVETTREGLHAFVRGWLCRPGAVERPSGTGFSEADPG